MPESQLPGQQEERRFSQRVEDGALLPREWPYSAPYDFLQLPSLVNVCQYIPPFKPRSIPIFFFENYKCVQASYNSVILNCSTTSGRP
jgi:hypothetical protein